MDKNRWFLTARIFHFLAKGCFFFAGLLFLNQDLALAGTLEDYFIFLENDKKGIRDADHHVVVPAMYDDLGWSVGAFQPMEEVVGYKEDGLWGLMTLKNKKISAPLYQNLYPLSKNQIVASKPNGHQEIYGIIDMDGQTLLNFEYSWFSPFNNLLVASKSVDSQLKYGIMNRSFNEVLPFKYTEIKMLNNQFAVIRQDQLLGLVSASGQVVVEPKYHELKVDKDGFMGRFFTNFEIRDYQNELIGQYQGIDLRTAGQGVILASGSNQSQILNPNGQLVKSFRQTEVSNFEGNKAVIKQRGLFGIIDADGNEVLAPTKKSAWISGGFIGIQEIDGNWKLFDIDLKPISSRDYQEILPATEGLFPVKRLDSWGYIDEKGQEIIPPQYQEAGSFIGGSADARYMGSWGVIDLRGNWLIRPRYELLEKLDGRTYIFQNGTKYGIVNTAHQEVYQCTNPLVATQTGAIEKSPDQKYGLISPEGEKMLSLQYHRIVPFEEDPSYYLFEDDQGLGLFNISKRSFFSDTVIQEMRTLDEGFIGVRINNQYGLIDLNGKLRIANRYEDIGVFSEEMLPVKIRGKWGFVDKLERLKVQPLYHTADGYSNGVAVVSRNDKYGLLNKDGKVILSLEYDRIERLPEGLFVCYRGQQAGLADASGKMLIYPRYSGIEILENGNLVVSRNGRLGLVNSNGRTLIPAAYDEIVYDPHNNLYLLAKQFSWEKIVLTSDQEDL